MKKAMMVFAAVGLALGASAWTVTSTDLRGLETVSVTYTTATTLILSLPACSWLAFRFCGV